MEDKEREGKEMQIEEKERRLPREKRRRGEKGSIENERWIKDRGNK